MNKHVGLEMPSVLGMGISGPVLAVITGTFFSAFKSVFGWTGDAYAVIMIGLSGMLALFPVVNSQYSRILKLAMWPVATLMIFVSAWGSSTGMSVGEEILSSGVGVNKETAEPIGAIIEPGLSSTNMALPVPGEIMMMRDLEDDSTLDGRFFKRLK